ncbi:MAG: hypothetical protein L3J46_02315 [Kangiellaceae bacterium]|nr:hypothetical protein [Kangiellaceae bacterium]
MTQKNKNTAKRGKTVNLSSANNGIKILKSENLKILLFFIFSLSLVISYAYRYFYPLEQEVDYQHLTLTRGNGIKKLPTFSPDGKVVVFVQRNEGVFSDSIVLIEPILLTKSLLLDRVGYILDLAWSPNSKRIIYSQWQSIHNRECKINVIDLDDDYKVVSHQELLKCSDRSQVRLAWDSKSEKFYFNERESLDRPYSVFSYSLATNRKTQLMLPAQTENLMGNVYIIGNSSGSLLAIARDQKLGKTELSIFETKQDNVISTGHMLDDLDSMTWFGSENKLLVSAGDQLQIYDYQKHDFEVLMPKPPHSGSFHMNESENMLVYMTSQSNLDILSYDLSENPLKSKLKDLKPINITNQSSNEYTSSFANHSNTVAYLSDSSGKTQIWLRDINGEKKQVSDSPISLGISPLKWSPDDQFILFQHEGEVFRLVIVTKQIERLIDSSHKAFIANWDRTNDAIFYSSEKSGEWQIWHYNLLDRQHRQITKNGGYSASQHVNGDLYVSRLHEVGLWRLTIEDNYENAEKIIDDFDAANWMSWQLADDNIYYVSLSDGHAGIIRYHLSNGSKQKMFVLDSQMKPYFSINDNELLITKIMNSESSIELINY